MKGKTKYKEIYKLEHLLREKKIPFRTEPWLGGIQITVPEFGPVIASAIEHDFSYGSALDLIEIQIRPGGVRGFLTAEHAMEHIEGAYEAKKEQTESIQDKPGAGEASAEEHTDASAPGKPGADSRHIK